MSTLRTERRRHSLVGSKAASKPQAEEWSVDVLHPHPRQSENFGGLAVAGHQALLADMQAHGLRQPVEILPDGTIVCGHQRVAAARQLGWTTINCIVRHDLASDPAACERHLIRDNLVRRQLGPIDRARLAKRLWELGECDAPDPRTAHAALVRHIAEAMDITPRNARRYVAVIALPFPVQQAFASGDLRLALAEKLGTLCDQDLQKIVEQMGGGVEPRKAVAAVLRPSARRHANADKWAAWLRSGEQLTTSSLSPGDLAIALPESKATLASAKAVSDYLVALVASLEQQVDSTSPRVEMQQAKHTRTAAAKSKPLVRRPNSVRQLA